MSKTKVVTKGLDVEVLSIVYQHFRGDQYRVLFMAANSGTDARGVPMVVYMSLKDGNLYTRPRHEWFDYVDVGQKYGVVPRFTPVR